MFSFLPNELQNIESSQRQYSQRFDYYNRFHTKSSFNVTDKLTFDCKRVTATSILIDIPNIGKQQFKPQNQLISQFAEKFIKFFFNSQQTNLIQNPTQNKNFLLQTTQQIKSQEIEYIDTIFQSFQKFCAKIQNLISSQQTSDMIEIQIEASTLSIFKSYEMYLKNITLKKILSGKYCPLKYLLDRILIQITEMEKFSHLMISQNILSPDHLLVHPLMIPLLTYIQQKSNATENFGIKCPKIAFINLDGSDSAFNTYLASQYQHLFYFSIYCQKQLRNSETQILQEAKSQAIFKFRNFTTWKGSNVFQIPLHSKYIKRKMQTKYQEDQQKINQKITSLPGQSEDIYYIFKEIIQPQIIQWKPSIIILSYSGELKIKPTHFNQIIKSLTICSSHRLILFPNLPKKSKMKMSQLFIQQRSTNKQQDQIFTEQFLNGIDYLQQAQEQSKSQYKLSDDFFKNMANFMMISTGSVSLSSCFQWNNYDSIQNSKRLQYLQTLQQIIGTQLLQKSKIKWIQGDKLSKFYQQQNQMLIKFHQSSQQDYIQLIDKCIQQYANVQQNLPQNLVEKLKILRKKQQCQKFQITHYFNRNKQKMLLQNINKPKLNKVFNIQQIKENVSQYQAYAFYIKDLDQKLLLQNYTQTIFSTKTNEVFVMNASFLSTKAQTRYFWGNIQNKFIVELHYIEFLGKKLPNYHHYVNFSYCFTQKYIILYWPYLYNLIDETNHKLFGEQYTPIICNSFFSIELLQKNKKMKELQIKKQNMLIQPRVSSKAYVYSDSQILIFGGFYNFQWSQKLIQTPIISITLNLQNNYLQLSQVKKNSNVKIKPKALYKIQRKQQSIIEISQGIGYQFTNLFTMFPQNQYQYNILKKQLVFRKSFDRPLKLNKPIPIKRKGKYLKAEQNKNQISLIQKSGFINGVRYIVPINQDQGILSFESFIDQLALRSVSAANSLSQGYSINSNYFQLSSSQNYWSPYINLKKGELNIQIQLLLQARDFGHKISINDYVFPNQDSIISICTTTKGKLYLLANSQFYTKSYPTIFEGANVKQQTILKKKQLKMNRIYQLKSSMNVQTKTIYSNESVVKILGGKINNQGIRQNYQINIKSCKKKLKVLTLKYSQDSYLVEMQYPQIIQSLSNIYLYAICYDFDAGWCLKIEKIDQKKKIHQFKILSMLIVDKSTKQILKNQFMKPYISITQPYKRQKVEKLKEIISTIVILIKKQYQDNVENEELWLSIEQEIKIIVRVLNQKLLNTTSLKHKIIDVMKLIKKITRPIDNQIKSFIIKSLEIIQKMQIQNFFEKQLKKKDNIYWFVIKDKVFKKWVYFGLGQIGSCQIVFYKTRKITNIFNQIDQFLKRTQIQEQTAQQNQFKAQIIKQFEVKSKIWAQ